MTRNKLSLPSVGISSHVQLSPAPPLHNHGISQMANVSPPIMPGQHGKLIRELLNLVSVLRMNGLLSEAHNVETAAYLIEQGGREVETLVQKKPDFTFEVRPMALHFSDDKLARFRVFNDDNKPIHVAVTVKPKPKG